MVIVLIVGPTPIKSNETVFLTGVGHMILFIVQKVPIQLKVSKYF